VGIRSAVPVSERDKTVTDLRLGMNSASSFHMSSLSSLGGKHRPLPTLKAAGYCR
jgi:hypothetical protein